jgi:hypothetical protein
MTKTRFPHRLGVLAVLAGALLLQACASNYYACRQQGLGITTCDDRSRGHLG